MPNHNYRIQRGWILRELNNIYPRSLHQSVVLETLKEMNFVITEKILEGHIKYLSDHGKCYVRYKKVGKGHVTLRLTSRGVDLCESNIAKDPGVEMEIE